jgi:hypothetical protein
VLEAGRATARTVAGAAAELPAVSYPALTPTPAISAAGEEEEEEEEDKPWYEDAWNAAGDAAEWTGEQAVGFGKGFGEGVVGIGEGGLMLYRLSPANFVFDRGSFEQEWTNVGRTAQFAYENPGEFGKALANWEDLSEGRYGEWLGGIGPDALVAAATAGSGAAVTRGLKSADTLADVGQTARKADRAGDAGRAAGRAEAPAAAARTQRLSDLRAQAAATGVKMPEAGMTVYRTYGEVPEGWGFQRGSGPFGTSWTPVPIDKLPNPRADLGLPPYNGGRYVITGRLDDPASVSEIRRALPWDDVGGYSMPGGTPEYLIPDADRHIEVLRVEGVNPDF